MGALFGKLQKQEARALLLMSIHGDIFDPEFVQEMAKLPDRESAEQVMMAWEALSLATFVGVDSNDSPFYTIPTVVNTFILGKVSEKQLHQIHRNAARVMQGQFFRQVKAIHEREQKPLDEVADPFTVVVEHLRLGQPTR